MDRQLILQHWDEAWESGLWAAPWNCILDDLTLAHLTWRPQPERHCIWEYVRHMLFWREFALRATRGEAVDEQERTVRNFEMPSHPTAADAERLRQDWERSHQEVRSAIADERNALTRLQFVAYHDSYHVGQIMLLRAMQGLKPIE